MFSNILKNYYHTNQRMISPCCDRYFSCGHLLLGEDFEQPHPHQCHERRESVRLFTDAKLVLVDFEVLDPCEAYRYNNSPSLILFRFQ